MFLFAVDCDHRHSYIQTSGFAHSRLGLRADNRQCLAPEDDRIRQVSILSQSREKEEREERNCKGGSRDIIVTVEDFLFYLVPVILDLPVYRLVPPHTRTIFGTKVDQVQLKIETQ